jgi:hypothetical protein
MILFRPLGRGPVVILSGDQIVTRGHLSVVGIRLDFVAPELEPIAAELALGLALRGQVYLMALSGGGSDNIPFVMAP